MRFDLALKKVIATNINLFGHLMQYFDQRLGENHAFLASLCKVGYQNNFFIGKSIEKMEFVPGDDEAAETEARIMGQATENFEETDNIAATPEKIQKAPDNEKSFQEFMKIINTEDYPIIEYKEKDGEYKQPEGYESSGSTGPGNKVTHDWYKKLFGTKSRESLPGEVGPSPDSPESSKGEERK